MTRRVVLATHNEHKVKELQQILAEALGAEAELGLEIVSMAAFPEVGEIPETSVTFAGNARLKAEHVAMHTSLPALADDSGPAVEVLGGSPGIFSARWSGLHAGEDLPRAEKDRRNLQLLLDQLADVRDEHRRAAFRCAAVPAIPGGTTVTSEGEVPGVIVREPLGDNGFGYDPIFVPDGGTRTLAQYSDVEKNAISHRGRAFRAMVPLLREHLSTARP
ncbi:RdgB/HAM1 family non-canonical purine NTP pyrophosphatase [Janibacter limosus]|uniref:RdgB/HAM1 family non-canonical purine NTP pyrophosphatase n=1 Tax=Janibacter limosus TaxID=53458 RepID=A0AC61U1M7_9MICO|nr:RdgB/HAM1 family non-canonical purine NTP pyrophosphatase [Janibacter limosus]UUZ43901.1 RdgB/HAM1 family non-canonical purine NTP pyrophosphatase [Janibacter limosus]